MERESGLTAVSEILGRAAVDLRARYEAQRDAAMKKIDYRKEFTQGGEIYCKRCRRVKSYDDPERGMFLNCVCECEATEDAEKKRRETRVSLAEKYRRLSYDELGKTYALARFDRMDASGITEETLTAAERCQRFCDNFSRVRDTGRGIWLYGATDVGKTYLAVCVLHELESRGEACLFTTWTGLLSRLKSTYGKSESGLTEYDFMRSVSGADCLIIDGLDAVKPKGSTSGWAMSKFTEIVKRRYDYKKPTVITSRSSLQSLAISDGIPTDVAGRLIERQVVLKLTGEPHRRQIAAAEF